MGKPKTQAGRAAEEVRRLLQKKLHSVGLDAGRGGNRESGSGRKMSEVLLQLIEPHLRHVRTRELLDQLVSTAVLAWNTSLLPEDKRAEFLDEAGPLICGASDRKAVHEFKSAMHELINRKLRFFSEDERVVVSYEFRTVNGKDKLVVASLRGASGDSGGCL